VAHRATRLGRSASSQATACSTGLTPHRLIRAPCRGMRAKLASNGTRHPWRLSTRAGSSRATGCRPRGVRPLTRRPHVLGGICAQQVVHVNRFRPTGSTRCAPQHAQQGRRASSPGRSPGGQRLASQSDAGTIPSNRNRRPPRGQRPVRPREPRPSAVYGSSPRSARPSANTSPACHHVAERANRHPLAAIAAPARPATSRHLADRRRVCSAGARAPDCEQGQIRPRHRGLGSQAHPGLAPRRAITLEVVAAWSTSTMRTTSREQRRTCRGGRRGPHDPDRPSVDRPSVPTGMASIRAGSRAPGSRRPRALPAPARRHRAIRVGATQGSGRAPSGTGR